MARPEQVFCKIICDYLQRFSFYVSGKMDKGSFFLKLFKMTIYKRKDLVYDSSMDEIDTGKTVHDSSTDEVNTGWSYGGSIWTK